jgi:hypothetical protein
MFQIIGAMAKFERAMIQERVNLGQTVTIRTGAFVVDDSYPLPSIAAQIRTYRRNLSHRGNTQPLVH